MNQLYKKDMALEAYTQTILGRPFLATSGYKIDVKEDQLNFDVGICHVEFKFFQDQVISPTLLLFDEVPISHEIEMDDLWCCTDPPIFDWISTTGLDLDYVKAVLFAPISPSITKDGPLPFNEGSSSAH